MEMEKTHKNPPSALAFQTGYIPYDFNEPMKQQHAREKHQ